MTNGDPSPRTCATMPAPIAAALPGMTAPPPATAVEEGDLACETTDDQIGVCATPRGRPGPWPGADRLHRPHRGDPAVTGADPCK
jgi:hypothetical protein